MLRAKSVAAIAAAAAAATRTGAAIGTAAAIAGGGGAVLDVRVPGLARDAGLGIIRGEFATGCRCKADRSAGVVAPAVGVGKFLTGMMEPIDLILKAGPVTLLDDGGGYEDEQVALGPGIDVLLKGVADNGDIAEDRDLVVGLCDLILKKAADR
jgi:hypothetical protein